MNDEFGSTENEIQRARQSAYKAPEIKEGETAPLIELVPGTILPRDFRDFEEERWRLFVDIIRDFNTNSGNSFKIKVSKDTRGKLKNPENLSLPTIHKIEEYVFLVFRRQKASALNLQAMEIDLAALLAEIISARVACFCIPQADGEIVKASIKLKDSKAIINLSEIVIAATRNFQPSISATLEKFQ